MLVANFECLNPANTIWNKQYNLYAKVDTEAARFLQFETWWGAFYIMTGHDPGVQWHQGVFQSDPLRQKTMPLGRTATLDDIAQMAFKIVSNPSINGAVYLWEAFADVIRVGAFSLGKVGNSLEILEREMAKSPLRTNVRKEVIATLAVSVLENRSVDGMIYPIDTGVQTVEA